MTVPAYSTDVLVIPALRAVRSCAAQQFALAGRLPCRFPITWNVQQPPADACDCFCGANGHGQAWVRWVTTEPGDMTGGKAMASAGCADGTYEITLEMGVYRCWPVPEKGPLDEGEEEMAALGMLVDAAVLRRSLLCCPYLEEKHWELIKEEPVGHSGGCTGVLVQWRLIDQDCACLEPSELPLETRQQALQSLGGTTS